jgi:hypothetical protein
MGSGLGSVRANDGLCKLGDVSLSDRAVFNASPKSYILFRLTTMWLWTIIGLVAARLPAVLPKTVVSSLTRGGTVRCRHPLFRLGSYGAAEAARGGPAPRPRRLSLYGRECRHKTI